MYLKFKPQSLFTGHTIIEGGNTVVVTSQDGTIVDLIPASEAGEDCQELNGILSPGFINAHCHLELSHLKGAIPTQTGLSEFVKQIVPKRAAPQEIIDAAIEAAENEMLQNGIVAVGDLCNTADTIAAKTKGKLAYYNFIEIYEIYKKTLIDKKVIKMEKIVIDNIIIEVPKLLEPYKSNSNFYNENNYGYKLTPDSIISARSMGSFFIRKCVSNSGISIYSNILFEDPKLYINKILNKLIIDNLSNYGVNINNLEELKKYLDEFDFSIDDNDPNQPILIWSEHFKKTKDLDGDSCYGFKKTAYDELMDLFYGGIIEEGGLTYFKVIGDDSKLPENHGWIMAEVVDEMNDKIFFSVQQWG
jgi:hypothetical protein